jgi:hypothetical protein
VALGLALVPFLCWWSLKHELIHGGSEFVEASLVVIAVFVLFSLVLLNETLRRWAPRLVFSQGELLTIYVMLTTSLAEMAGVALKRGDPRAARVLLEERLAICRKLGDSDLLVHALGAMGHLERDEGDYGRARAFYQESLLLRRELGSLFALAQSLQDLAVLAGRERHPERAIRLLGAGEAFCERLGARPPVAMAPEYERTVAEGRAAMGETAFAAAWAEGRAMSLEQAVDYALGDA